TKLESSTNGGYAESTISSTNISSYDYVTAWVKSSVIGQSLSLGMGESVSNEQTEKVYVDSLEWQKVYWDITDIASADRDAITKLRITNNSSTPNTFYIDNVKVEKLPTSGLDSIHSTANDYFQYRVIFTTTDQQYKPQFNSISFTYNIGYDIVQIDSNTVRMYNHSGSTKKLRLDIVAGSLMFDLSQGSSTGSVNIAPQMAQIDDSGMNSIWINKTVAGGNLLKLQTLGVDAFVVNSDGDTLMAGDIQVQGGNLQLGSTGWIRFNESTEELEFTNDGSSWIALGPTFTNTVLSAEYAGAVLSADGSSNTGNMTADNEGTSANSMNYYEWNSSETSLNDYDVRIRFTLPSDFDTWGTGGGIRFNFATESTGTTNNQLDFYVYKEDSATIDGSLEDQASATAGTWTSTFVSGSTLNECASAGDVCVLVVKMSSANDNYVRVGDIEIGYERKL
ncbi:hypothetical protein GYA44_00010, partial [Candidatus Microgenomates bacterium]|nr:hypothetical protein [Candidatus Microgenomates bacterium]